MGMAQLVTRYLLSEDINAQRSTKIFLRGQRTNTGSMITRTIPLGITFVCQNLTWATDGNATDAIFDIIFEFSGTVQSNLRVSQINNSVGFISQIPVNGLSFLGDGVAILEARLANKSGGGTVTCELRGYERNSLPGD